LITLDVGRGDVQPDEILSLSIRVGHLWKHMLVFLINQWFHNKTSSSRPHKQLLGNRRELAVQSLFPTLRLIDSDPDGLMLVTVIGNRYVAVF
jgi:hypothetical protein